MIAPLLIAGLVVLGIGAVIAAGAAIAKLIAAGHDADQNFSSRRVGSPTQDCGIIRQDNDFRSKTSDRKGAPAKSYIDDDGDLIPVDPEGKTSPLEHIYGSQPAKGNSPYTSFLTEEGGIAKTYGSHEIELALGPLQSDIANGKLSGVEVLTPSDLERMIKKDIKAIAPAAEPEEGIAGGPEGIDEYVASLGLSRSNSAKLARRLLALFNTTRDREYLIRGSIPSKYLKGPYQSGDTRRGIP
jgi:hypothetical protein